MTRAGTWTSSLGVLLFVGVLASQGLPAIVSTLALAGWGLLLVALFHLVPLALDAASIRVMFDTTKVRSSLRDALFARWVGESANSFLPAGPIGGPAERSVSGVSSPRSVDRSRLRPLPSLSPCGMANCGRQAR